MTIRSYATSRRPAFGIPEATLAIALSAGVFKSALPIPGPFDVTLVTTLAVAAAMALSFYRGGFRTHSGVLVVCALLAIFAFPLFWTPSESYSLQKTIRFFALTSIYALAPIFLLRSQASVRRFLNAFLVIGALVAAAALYAPVVLGYGGRSTIAGSNPIATGRLAATSLFLILALIVEGKRGLFFGLAVSTPLAVVLLSTGSRGPLVACAFGVGTYALIWAAGRLNSRAITRIVVPIGLLIISGLILAPQASLDRLSAASFDDPGDSIEARSAAFETAIEIITETPLGMGWGSFAGQVSERPNLNYPHNILLEVGAELGWASLIALIVTCIGALRVAQARCSPSFRALYFGFFVMVGANALVSGDLNDNRLLFTWLFIPYALPRKYSLDSSIETFNPRSQEIRPT